MNRRLRKKKRVGEFRELGFQVYFRLRAGMSENDLDAFCDRLISAVEVGDLEYGGGMNLREGNGFIAHLGRGSATEADREAMRAWFEAEPAVVAYWVGALVDAWYGKYEGDSEWVVKE